MRLQIIEYFFDFWNLFDLICLLLFIVGLTLRCFEETLDVGHLFYALDVGLWIVRLINVLYVSEVCGPYVVMIGYMVRSSIKVCRKFLFHMNKIYSDLKNQSLNDRRLLIQLVILFATLCRNVTSQMIPIFSGNILIKKKVIKKGKFETEMFTTKH